MADHYQRPGWFTQHIFNPAVALLTRGGVSIAGYDDAFGAVTRQTVQPTLDAAGVKSGMRVLDVCCGPGMLAEGAIKRGANAVGLDFSSVVELARKGMELQCRINGEQAELQVVGKLPARLAGNVGVVAPPGSKFVIAALELGAR